MSHIVVKSVTYGVLGVVAAASCFLPEILSVPGTSAATPPDQILLTGMVRDFRDSHPDFDVVPDNGYGNYAGNVTAVLPAEGRPLQVHGVDDFVVSFGRLVPGVRYAARATVLGAEITSGGEPIPVTIQAETDTEIFEPFGDYDDPAVSDVNDGANPREYVFSLTDVYSASTPISITATSWLEGGGGGSSLGHKIAFSNESGDADSKQPATQVTLPQDGTVTSITAYVKHDDGVMYGLYTDSAGEPGTLIVDTDSTDSPIGWNWYTKSITPTWLAAGTYWLAISQDEVGQKVMYDNTGGETRQNNYNAEDDGGFQATWSGTTNSWPRRVSIYATYTPDVGTYSAHMTVASGEDSPYVEVLIDGDAVPDIPAFQDQSTVHAFVEDHVDVDTGLITLNDNQAIYLFELGTTNLASPSADFQDLVMLVTLATDPAYFFAAGTTSEGAAPIGYKVDTPWTDSAGRNIAPHTCDTSGGDSVGSRGVTSSGGVTSPATFAEWFRDIMAINQSVHWPIALTDDGSGVWEHHSNAFHPVDDRLYGNEGAGHNNSFTYSLNTTFTYDSSAGQFIEFEGGDGAWIYVDGNLVIDLGGVQTKTLQHADLDRLDLVEGNTYEISLFYANRNPMSSEFHLRTNVSLTQGQVLGSVTAAFD